MLRTQFVSYLNWGLRVKAINTKNIAFSANRLCKAETIEDDFHEPKFKEVRENRLSMNKHSRSSKSVLFDLKDEAFSPLESCSSIEEVFTYLRSNPKIDFQLYAPTFNTILKLYKSGQSNKLSAEELCRRREFEILSKNVNRNVRFLNVDDAVTILKVLTTLGISTNSLLCQSLLQIISKHINRLGISQVRFLYFILKQSARSPLVDGLKIAIPMVFEAHVRSQLDNDDTSEVSFAVRFACHEKCVTDETRNLLVDTALEKTDSFKVSEAYGMVKALQSRRDNSKNADELFKKLVCILTKNMDQLKSHRINEIVSASIDKYLYVHESFFDENLIKTSIQYFISNKINLVDTGKLLQQLVRVSYYCPELLDYYDSQLKVSVDSINCSNILVTSFVKACSNCMYKPNNWDSYEQKIISFLELKTEQNDVAPWIVRVTLDLLILKCYPKTLVNFSFQNDVLHEGPSKGYKMDLINLLRMYHVVKLLYTDHYNGPDPPAHILEKAVALLNRDKEYHLLGALQAGLGGPQYVLNGVKTKLGQVIDYLIVKRESGELYPLNPTEIAGNSNISYESLNIPEDSYPVAIMLLSPSSYCLDGYKLRGKTEIMMQCYEAYGITTIPISHYRWLELQDAEKITYLTDKINQCVPVTSSYKRSNNA